MTIAMMTTVTAMTSVTTAMTMGAMAATSIMAQGGNKNPLKCL